MPAIAEDLISFQKSLGFKLPEDYYNFLTICNGCSLFDDPQYGGYMHGKIYTRLRTRNQMKAI
ncbi:SMI1/KNR4 family protein [Paenibacillus sp. V4I7]|nr:SMI1/KNR4 family protein [Paenibacillus sp. V4I7]